MVEIDERDGLARQNKDTLDLTTLSAATPEVISRQVSCENPIDKAVLLGS